MGSSLVTIIRRANQLTVNLSGRGDNLQCQLAFGPEAALDSLAPRDDDEFINIVSGEIVQGTVGVKSGLAEVFLLGAGHAVIEYDDKMLWYKTDSEWEYDSLWGAWYASWLSIFWPGWRIFRPVSRFDRGGDLLSLLGIPVPDDKYPLNVEEYLSEANPVSFINGDSSQWGMKILICKSGEIFHCKLKDGNLRDLLVMGIDEAMAAGADVLRRFDINDKNGISSYSPPELLIDMDRRVLTGDENMSWVKYALETTSPGWRVVADRQGFLMWLKRIGKSGAVGAEDRRWVHHNAYPLGAETFYGALSDAQLRSAALRCGVKEELLPKVPLLKDVPRQPLVKHKGGGISIPSRTAFASYWDREDKRTSNAFRQQIMFHMADIYAARPNIAESVLTDRSHKGVNPDSQCPYDWTPTFQHLLWSAADRKPLKS